MGDSDMLRIAVCLLALVYVDAVRDTSDCKDVMTEAGPVRGCVDAGGNYFAFLGVPYAAPPTGILRFKPPIKPDPWEKVFEANRIVKCPQNHDGDENCLIVNIFSPAKSSSRPLPVLFYIHGGSFLMGTGQSKGVEPLTKLNIIVVTLNYRLGVLGFLCLGTEKAPGNVGLKDQLAALRWVKQNIANFGGNPNRVTMYGMSAGGASVEMQVLSKQGKGLFHQAIVESASATSVWTIDFNPIKTALDFAGMLGIARNTKVNVLGDYYQKVPIKELSTLNFDYYNNLTDGTFGFVPCVENMNLGNDSDAFMTESPYDILMKEDYEKVPMMYLFSAQEGLFLRSEEYYLRNYTERMTTNFADFLPADLIFDSAKTRDAISQNIKDFYFGNTTIRENVMGYLKYFGDCLILHGLLNSVEIHSRNENPVYLMEFAYKGGMGSYEKFFDNINEAGHGDVIKHAILNKSPASNENRKAVERISKLIANFVRFGNPTPEKTHLLPVIWPRVSPGNVSCLYMDQEFTVIDKPHWEAKKFWDVLYSKYRRKIRPVK